MCQAVYIEKDVGACVSAQLLPEGATVIAIHACGAVTDVCLDTALHLRGKFAVMPCCYGPPPGGLPPALHAVLGRGLAQDVARTFRMHSQGYNVDWCSIPLAITNKNRIMWGVPRPLPPLEPL